MVVVVVVLWRRKPEDNMDVYQYVRHIFGAKCSPACAIYALRRTAQDNKDTFPADAKAVERKFYMYDLFKSILSLLEACSLQAGLVNLLSLVGFRLTKWISNDRGLLNAIPEKERTQSVRSIGDEGTLPIERALVVTSWDVEHDTFVFKIKPKEQADTRRKVISLTSSIFDPIGFLAPFVIRGKIFLQSLWNPHQRWDERKPEEFLRQWSDWHKELEKLAEFSIPRFYRSVTPFPTSIQLHVFGDASE